MKNWKVALGLVLFASIMSSTYMNCGGKVVLERNNINTIIGSEDTVSGNPIVQINAAAYSTPLQNFGVCVLAIEVSSDSGLQTLTGDSITKILSMQGSVPLFTRRLPVGSYTQVRLRLQNNCSSGWSFSFENLNGPIVVPDEVVMLFNGNFTIAAETVNTLNLNFESFAAAFSTAVNAEAAVEAAAIVDGSFE